MSLRLKLVLLILAPLFGVFAIILALGLQAFEENARERIAHELAQSAELHAERIEVLLREVAEIATITAAHLSIDSKISETAAFDILRSNVSSTPLVFGAAIAFEPGVFPGKRIFAPYVYRQGRALKEIVATELDYDYTQPEWDWWHLPRNALTGVWTEPYFDEGGGNIYMTTYSVPFFRDERFVGVTTIDIPLEPLKQLISSLQGDQGQRFLLLSARQRILFSDDASLIGQPVRDVLDKAGRQDIAAAIAGVMDAKDTRMLRVRGWGTENFQWISPAFIGAAGWTLLSIQDEQTALVFLERQKWRAITILGSVFIVTLLAAWFILAWVTRPVRDLSRAALEVGRGNLYVDIKRQSNDEIGDLAASFASMVRQLSSREAAFRELNENLEHRVEARTAELKSLQLGLERARDIAVDANRAKSEFLANISHELRTPMNAILGYSEMLIEEAGESGQEDIVPELKKIRQAGNRLLELINDVLDISIIESGKMEVSAEDFDLDRMIDDVSITVQPLMEKNNNSLTVERDAQLGNACQDQARLRQVLFNLLSNAAKFTHAGVVTLRVNRVEQDGQDWLECTVKDTGIGIPEDKIECIFEEFIQADGSATRDYGGTGLGLSIARRFCQLLGGDLTVVSEHGKGSEFTVFVPVKLPGTPAW